jgi:hypothetical protein
MRILYCMGLPYEFNLKHNELVRLLPGSEECGRVASAVWLANRETLSFGERTDE